MVVGRWKGGLWEKEGMIQGLEVQELPFPFCHGVQKNKFAFEAEDVAQQVRFIKNLNLSFFLFIVMVASIPSDLHRPQQRGCHIRYWRLGRLIRHAIRKTSRDKLIFILFCLTMSFPFIYLLMPIRVGQPPGMCIGWLWKLLHYFQILISFQQLLQ